MSDLPDEVMNRAVEAASRGAINDMESLVISRLMIEAAAPILIEAERERIKARIEAQAGKHDKWAEIDEKASRTSEDDYFKSESFSMRAAHHRIRAETLRAALSVIDKEGGTVGSGNQEEQ